MKLPLREPSSAKYIYISPENIVHIWMPVVSGEDIGLDNTCKAVYSLQEFFDKGTNSNKKASIKAELLAYKEALEHDISLLGTDSKLTQEKQERLSQIEAYLNVVIQLEKNPELDCLNKGFPSYPRPLEDLMQDRQCSNLDSMILRPSQEDRFIRLEGTHPIFSVAHNSEARGIEQSMSPLQQALIGAYSPLTYKASDFKSNVIKQVVLQLGPSKPPVDFEKLRTTLKKAIYERLNISNDFNMSTDGKILNQDYINEIMGYETGTTTAEEYLEALLTLCTPKLFSTMLVSPFDVLVTDEGWSIATQFLLGITNIHAFTKAKISSDTNFGQILDANPALSNHLAQTLAQAQQSGADIEKVCLSWINAHVTELRLKAPLSKDDIDAIKERFALLYAYIKDAPHFDEFVILDKKRKGNFVTHQGSICTSFAAFASSPLLNLPPELIQSLKRARTQAPTLNTEIPHKNSINKGEVDINTKTLDNGALQALYEQINNDKDLKLKKELLAQLKQERPDFKPKIDAKQFLQHVAYGEQDEAEALLKQNPELAQALLQADGIPFTDYSGRTFTCTAYEYAYWAKDSHMQRMLEKYIRIDEETRQLILQRVQDIEKPVPAAGYSGFWGILFGPVTKPQGLHYTIKDKQGIVIVHQDAGFDLTPLINALQHYVSEFNKKSNRTEADWEALDKIWIEEVGRAQREIPAHIAHEYCHPDRSFKDINNKKELLSATEPSNLKRQLKFFNFVTDNTDVWFSPNSYSLDSGLGFSFGILRGLSGRAWGMMGGMGGRNEVWIGLSIDDLPALTTIDKVRTNDRKESQRNLSQPLNPKEFQAYELW